MSVARTRCRSVCANDHSPPTDSSTAPAGIAATRSSVAAQVRSSPAKAERRPSGSPARLSARPGKRRFSSLSTNGITSTPLTRRKLSPSESHGASMSAPSTWTPRITTPERLASTNRAPRRSTSMNSAPCRSTDGVKVAMTSSLILSRGYLAGWKRPSAKRCRSSGPGPWPSPVARSASHSPSSGPNLKPCPEVPLPTTTFPTSVDDEVLVRAVVVGAAFGSNRHRVVARQIAPGYVQQLAEQVRGVGLVGGLGVGRRPALMHPDLVERRARHRQPVRRRSAWQMKMGVGAAAPSGRR